MIQNVFSAVVNDAALQALFIPLSSGDLVWPAHGDVLFLGARAGAPLSKTYRDQMFCEQSFRPRADALIRDGFRVGTPDSAAYPLVLVLPPRQRAEARALYARALQYAGDGGVVLSSLSNNEGARSAVADLQQLAGPLHSLSKNKCRVFWSGTDVSARNTTLIAEWATLDEPRPIDEGRYLSRPGLFAWDRIDAASALLVQHLSPDLAGRGADLGAGYGYLADQVLRRCAAVSSLHLYEAEARALDLARCNLAQHAGTVGVDYFWHDVVGGLPQRYDFIVMNPPFHQGRADQPELGLAFIHAAADALRPGGRLLMVANRHLPYESGLNERFDVVQKLADESGFKVLSAIRKK